MRNEQFLCNYGGLESNDLTKILNSDSDIDENAATIINVSNYHDIDDLLNKPIFSKNNHFKILGFNTESINSKFDSIKLFLETLKQKDIYFLVFNPAGPQVPNDRRCKIANPTV